MSDWKQKLIDEDYGVDAARFEADYAASVEEGRKDAVSWDDFLVEAITLPNLKETARNLIETNLGYLPGDSTILPFEPYLRALIQSYWNGQLDEESFFDQVEDHIKLIRNADLKHNTCLKYDPEIYTNYHKFFAPYGHTVRERLTKFLGYEPDLDCSLIGEMWMRDLIARDTIQLPDTMTEADWKVITLIKYREILLEQGQEAADASPLIEIQSP